MFSRINREEQNASVAKNLQVLEGTLKMERVEAHVNPPKRLVEHPKKSKLSSFYHYFPNFRHLIGVIFEILSKNLL
jgi:hypothetical protein